MRFYAFHGVSEEERHVGAFFSVDLKLYLDLSKAAESDCLEDTVSYASIYSIVKNEMAVPSKLLEHLAGRIVRQIKMQFRQIRRVEIKLTKLNPPVGGEVDSASILLVK